ncbi:MAG: 2,3-bisphosphoglycerate-independent phosphoglycerate mutase [Wolbachia endosymbiont of Fragariocoptes setiger]|nr:2,3-bisphosphoglycerate-independent phosphoglycerate mutase [Wolbachia endosymbiont of Fragariocoptes setiger]
MNFKSLVLCILDGWGNGSNNKHNPIYNTNPTCWQYINSNYPKCSLSACGNDVGLPTGQIGNSEVGHMNIGSGRIVMQSLERINQGISEVEHNENFKNFVTNLKQKQGICHIMGLLSDGGVHSHQKHILTLAQKISNYGIEVIVHAFLDGRDTPPNSGKRSIEEFQDKLKIATISGRYYSMDRDNRWERTIKAYEAIAFANAPRSNDSISLINKSYKNGITDEFIEPTVIGDYQGIKPEDGIFLANFRADRVIQLVNILLNKNDYKKVIKFSSIIGMVHYSKSFDIPYLFSPTPFTNTLGQIISDHGLKQLRIAETEKYAHVTFFFNCGKENPFPDEERILVPSQKVATYDLQPEMSAPELTEILIKKILSKEFSLIVVNYANPDMVGHTGNIRAAKQAILTVDNCLSKILQAVQQVDQTELIITADHGNIECMFDEKNNIPHTAHTLNRVPFIVCSNSCKNIKLRNGRLSDIAPTILQLFDIKKPLEMNGNSLIL